MRRILLSTSGVALAVLFAGCASSEKTTNDAGAMETPVAVTPQPGATGSKLDDDLNVYTFRITTDSPEAQRWFDQGLVLCYGFNHGEAIRCFQEAAALDPEAAMPWWGIAYANGMNINITDVTEPQWADSYAASERAIALLDDETPMEKALVGAVSTRCTWPPPSEQRPFDEAYAAAMQRLHDKWPNHPDIGVLYAESLMNLQPWDYWTVEKDPKGRTAEFVGVIEHVLETDPRHPQACHLYIHAMEAGPDPARAEAAADRLLGRVPGAGHLEHMPSHLYARVGRYGDAVEANAIAVKADYAFFDQGTEPGAYWIYHAHNLHFLAFAAMMEGRYDVAIEAARELETAIPDPVLDQFAFLIEGIVPTTYHVMIRFGRWDEVLQLPAPPENRPVMLAVHHYARGISYSALGLTDDARVEQELFEAQVENVPADWWVFSNKVHDVLPIARFMLEGELAYREGRYDDAWAALRQGIAAEDALVYDEPPGWMLPVRHAMGALLMAQGEYAEAEQLYREDQERHPGNGWSLLGLELALEKQGKDAEAQRYQSMVSNAFSRVTEVPTSSCFCEP